jgi:drug/metabolite transporter (DMT)-like permease
MIAIVFGLSSAFMWGISDFLGGLVSRRLPAVAVSLISQAGALLFLAVVLLVSGKPLPTGDDAVVSVAAGVAVAVGVYCFYAALAAGRMGLAAPVGATGVTVPIAFGLATGEDPSALQFVGAATAFVGVLAVTRQRAARTDGDRRALLLAVGAALGFGFFFVGLDAASDANLFAVLFVVRVTTVTLLLATAGVTRTSLRVSGRSLLVLGGIGLLDLAANAAYIVATSEGLIIIASVLVSLYAGVTVLMARTFLAERMSATQGAGVAIALGGVGMIAAGG